MGLLTKFFRTDNLTAPSPLRTVSRTDYTLPEGRSLGLAAALPGGVPDSNIYVHPYPEGFRWNLTVEGETEAPIRKPSIVKDYKNDVHSIFGLPIWAWAQGDLGFSNIWHRPDVLWMAVEYDSAAASSSLPLSLRAPTSNLVIVPRCKTIGFSSDRKEVIKFIQKHTPEGKRGSAVDEYVVEVGEGDVTVGDGGVAFVRGKGTARAGDYGTAIAGRLGTAVAGDNGKAVAGDCGTASAGRYGVAIAGKGGVAQIDRNGISRAGVGGKLIFSYSKFSIYFGTHVMDRHEIRVGKKGIKPDTFYMLNNSGRELHEVTVAGSYLGVTIKLFA